MSKKFYKRDEQNKLIMECRQSGLSDYQWCSQNGINPGNFYNWVSKLRKIGYTFPESRSKSSSAPNIQEVVKVNLVEQERSSTIVEQNASTLPMLEKSAPAAELIIGNISLRLYNGADWELILNTIQCLGDVSRAW